MASLKYRYTIFIQRRFQWLGFDGLLYFLSVWEAGIQNCISNRNFSPAIGGWRAQRRERTALWPLASYWSSLAPAPASGLVTALCSGLGLTPRPETERGEMRLWCPLASSGLLWPPLASLASHQHKTLYTAASLLLVAKKPGTWCKIFTVNNFLVFLFSHRLPNW